MNVDNYFDDNKEYKLVIFGKENIRESFHYNYYYPVIFNISKEKSINNENNNKQKKNNIILIVGIILGSAVLIAIIFLIIYFYRKKKSNFTSIPNEN